MTIRSLLPIALLLMACGQADSSSSLEVATAATHAAPTQVAEHPAASHGPAAGAPPSGAVAEKSATAESEPGTDAASADAAAGSGHTLLFFLNPNGRPCQMQQQLLEEMGATLTDKVALREVSTQVPGDRPLLYQYGIRALPLLILVDDAGKELHRFTPGIQSPDTILAALD